MLTLQPKGSHPLWAPRRAPLLSQGSQHFPPCQAVSAWLSTPSRLMPRAGRPSSFSGLYPPYSAFVGPGTRSFTHSCTQQMSVEHLLCAGTVLGIEDTYKVLRV